MSNIDDEDNQLIVMDRVNDSVVAYPDSIRVFAGEFDTAVRAGLTTERDEANGDALPNGPWELRDGFIGSRRQRDPISHVLHSPPTPRFGKRNRFDLSRKERLTALFRNIRITAVFFSAREFVVSLSRNHHEFLLSDFESGKAHTTHYIKRRCHGDGDGLRGIAAFRGLAGPPPDSTPFPA
jgi:hypothetical protein